MDAELEPSVPDGGAVAASTRWEQRSGTETPAAGTPSVVTAHELAMASRFAADERSRRIEEKLRRELGGLICRALEDRRVVEIVLNPDGRLWVERIGEAMTVAGSMPASQAEALLATVASTLRTAVTRERPILECELPLDGSRFEAILPPIASRPVFAIRKRASRVITLDEYVAHGVMTAAQREALGDAVRSRKNILVAGGTGSGKTTLANGLVKEMTRATPEHRIVVLEDTPEIQCAAENSVALRTSEHVDMLRLLKATMRLRPDRIVVGEVRGAEALALLKAWNTGHPGGCSTVHANSAEAGLTRLEQLANEGTLAPVQTLIGEAVDLVVFMERLRSSRIVSEIASVLQYDARHGRYELERTA